MNKLEMRRGLRYRFDMQHDDDHDATERMTSKVSAVARHQVHDQAAVRSIAAAMRNVAARIESIERAIGLQAIEIERLDRVLVEIMQQQRGAAGDGLDRAQPVLDHVMQPTMQPGAIDAG